MRRPVDADHEAAHNTLRSSFAVEQPRNKCAPSPPTGAIARHVPGTPGGAPTEQIDERGTSRSATTAAIVGYAATSHL
jgi:hypothetical protein